MNIITDSRNPGLDLYAIRSEEHFPDHFWERFAESMQSVSTIQLIQLGWSNNSFFIKGYILPDKLNFQICAQKKGGYSIVGDMKAVEDMKVYIEKNK